MKRLFPYCPLPYWALPILIFLFIPNKSLFPQTPWEVFQQQKKFDPTLKSLNSLLKTIEQKIKTEGRFPPGSYRMELEEIGFKNQDWKSGKGIFSREFNLDRNATLPFFREESQLEMGLVRGEIKLREVSLMAKFRGLLDDYFLLNLEVEIIHKFQKEGEEILAIARDKIQAGVAAEVDLLRLQTEITETGLESEYLQKQRDDLLNQFHLLFPESKMEFNKIQYLPSSPIPLKNIGSLPLSFNQDWLEQTHQLSFLELELKSQGVINRLGKTVEAGLGTSLDGKESFVSIGLEIPLKDRKKNKGMISILNGKIQVQKERIAALSREVSSKNQIRWQNLSRLADHFKDLKEKLIPLRRSLLTRMREGYGVGVSDLNSLMDALKGLLSSEKRQLEIWKDWLTGLKNLYSLRGPFSSDPQGPFLFDPTINSTEFNPNLGEK